MTVKRYIFSELKSTLDEKNKIIDKPNNNELSKTANAIRRSLILNRMSDDCKLFPFIGFLKTSKPAKRTIK